MEILKLNDCIKILIQLIQKMLKINSVRRLFSFNYPCPRKLRQIMKISMIERETPERIKDIWQQYHHARTENISHSLTKDEYQSLKNHSKQAPMFMLPLRRQSGHFKLLSQAQNDSYLFTYLEDFKRHGSSAPPYFVLTLFPELLFQKGLVLVRGDIINFKLTKPEAEKLYEQLRRAYFTPEVFEMMVNFNHNTGAFSMEKYNELYNL